MALTINGIDVASLGFRLSSAPGWMDAPARATKFTPRANRPGGIQTGPSIDEPRRLVLEGVVDAITAQACRDNIDALKALVMKTQPAQIIFPDQTARYHRGFYEAHPTDPGTGPSMIARTLKQRMEFLCLDPYAYDVASSTGAVDAGVNRLLLGTAPSYPVITISGATVNPTLTLKKYDGTTIATMALTITDGGGDTLVIDSENMTIQKNGASVISTAITGDFLILDPAIVQNGVGATSGDRPYITVSSGSGTVAFRRAWR